MSKSLISFEWGVPLLLPSSKPAEEVKEMGKKLAIEYVKAKTKQIAEGYECLSEEYVNNHTKLRFRCGAGHEYEAEWANFQAGHRCPYCTGMKKKTIGEVKKHAHRFKFECLSKEYKNAHAKLLFKCNKNHLFLMSWHDFTRRHSCPVCSKRKKKTINEIREYVHKFKYECLSKKYKNACTKLKFKCPEGHIFEMAWSSFQRGQRCPYCSGNKKKNIEEIKEYAKRFNYKCLSEEYKNAHSKLEFKCDKGHIYKAEWACFQQGQRCPICFRENNRGENHPRWKNHTKEELTELENYEVSVRQLTQQNFHKYYYLINPNKLPRSYREYQLDHIYTIMDGFKNNVPPEIIASPINLQMLTAFENDSKHDRSDMTKEMLYDLYNQFEKETKEMKTIVRL